MSPHATQTPPASPDTPTDHASEGEERRQRAVESLGLSLDQGHERFDRITRLAHHVFGVPLASITVIDGDRARFPGRYGLPVRDMPREDTLCQRAHSLGHALVVHDLLEHDEFHDHPAVTRLGLRFYAGQPLRDPLGNVVGTLALYDTEPRELDDDLREALADMAGWAQQELVASDESQQARFVQQSMLPPEPLHRDGWDVRGVCLPSLAVGGDFYDHTLSRDVVHLTLADVMGKGTGAALLSASVRSAVRATHDAVTAGVDLGVTSTRVARTLQPDLDRSASFVTILEAALDLTDGYLRYVDAGSGLMVLRRADGTVEHLRGRGAPVGVMPDDSWTEQQDQLDPGDRLMLFSDGVLDLLDDELDWVPEVGELLGTGTSADDVLDAVAALVQRRTALDDVTVLVAVRAAEDAAR